MPEARIAVVTGGNRGIGRKVFLAALAAVAAALLTAAAGPQRPSSLDLAPKDEPGVRLVVHGRIVDPKGQPVAGAEIHAYQTDATGAYTRERPMDEPNARLSGWLQSDAAGRFELRTIRPGGYPKALRLGDRERHIPAHIHLDVKAPSFRERRLQAVFSDDPLLSDPYWVDWVKQLGQPMLVLRQGQGARVTDLVIKLDR
jgi:protocatechuate 3,4-dioxygenase beta subunit